MESKEIFSFFFFLPFHKKAPLGRLFPHIESNSKTGIVVPYHGPGKNESSSWRNAGGGFSNFHRDLAIDTKQSLDG